MRRIDRWSVGLGSAVTRSIRTAVALGYDGQAMAAPVVLAAGQGEIAERLVAIAEAHGVPIRQDPALAAMLARAELGEAIPVEAYEAVARILAVLIAADAARRSGR